MGTLTSDQEKKTVLKSWVIVVAMALLFILWGLFIFFTVGDKGPPPWNFGVVEDIPGQSPYSIGKALEERVPRLTSSKKIFREPPLRAS